MSVAAFRNLRVKAALLLLFGILSPIGESRSNVRIHELPASLVERVAYLGKGEFEVTLAVAAPTAGGKPTRFFDGKDKLSFVIQAESLDGTFVEHSKTSSGDLRTDSMLKGADFVNLLISSALRREKITLSGAFVPADEQLARGVYRLAYFQVKGDQG